jgi:hypothetical protein
LGAGDGYYPIGLMKSGLFSSAIAFEGSELRRDQMERLADINGCKKNIEIRGYASEDCFDDLEFNLLAQSVILSDIEGGEFNIFTEKNLKILSDSIIIIEIHDFLVPLGNSKLEELVNTATKYFKVTWLTTTGRNPSKFQELRDFNDIDRWLTMVEGRGPLMNWIRLDPRVK